MKHIFAIILFCIPALLAAQERCTKSHAHRAEASRLLDIGSISAWQKSVLFEQQIL